MLRYNAHKNSQGFTMVETLTIVIIVGILSAIAGPSFLALFNKNKVNDAVNQVRGALQEAQREAIRKSKNCTVIVPAGSSTNITSPPEQDINSNGVLESTEDINGNGVRDTNNCLVTGDRTIEGINIRRDNNTLGIITFDFKGRTAQGGSETQAIVFSLTNSTSDQERCLIISKPLGVIRTGIYNDTGHDETSVNPSNPSTDPNCAISRQ